MRTKNWQLILFIAVVCDLSLAEIFEECENKYATYVEVKEDCSFYIFCHGEESFTDACPSDSPYFSIEEQTCDANKNVCKDRPVKTQVPAVEEEDDEVEEITSSTSTAAPTSSSSSSGLTITIPTEATYSSLSTSTDFAVVHSTTTQLSASSNATDKQLITTTVRPPVPSVPTSCPPVDNPFQAIFLPHKKSCSEYFLCFQGERLPMRCSKMLHFDVRQQKCDYPENVKCHMMDVASPREQCLRHTFDVYPHPRNCNYYYQCILGFLKVMQCPLNMGWHYEKRACVGRAHSKCYSSFAKGF